MTSAHVLLLTPERETLAVVRSVLQGRALADTAVTCDTMADLRTRLARGTVHDGPRIAVVDIDGDPERILSDLGKVSLANPHVWFVVMSKGFEEKHVLRAMQAGARHFLRKNAIGTELDQVLDHLLGQKAETSARPGIIVSVFSCSGGCGATTATINLANELRLALNRRTLIVDLDVHYGASAVHLGLQGKYGVGHLLSREGAIDRHLIESTALTYVDGVDVLLSPATAQADAPEQMNYGRLPQLLDACQESYAYVLVDAPRLPRAALADLASGSRMAVVVLQLTVRDVAFARALTSFLIDRGMPRDRVLLLANQVRRHGPLLLPADTRRAIGVETLYCIRSDWARAVKSLNRGQPLAQVGWHSGLRRDFRKVADQIQRWTPNGEH